MQRYERQSVTRIATPLDDGSSSTHAPVLQSALLQSRVVLWPGRVRYLASPQATAAKMESDIARRSSSAPIGTRGKVSDTAESALSPRVTVDGVCFL